MAVRIKDKTFHFKADPFDTLRNLLNMFRLDNPDLPIPVGAGLLGYLSYDLKDSLEKLPRTSTDNLCLPHICLFAPSAIIVQDKADNTSWLCTPQVSSSKFQVSSFKVPKTIPVFLDVHIARMLLITGCWLPIFKKVFLT